jgi:hypothetical protein
MSPVSRLILCGARSGDHSLVSVDRDEPPLARRPKTECLLTSIGIIVANEELLFHARQPRYEARTVASRPEPGICRAATTVPPATFLAAVSEGAEQSALFFLCADR